MSERRFPIGLLLIAPVAVGFAVYAFTGQAQVADPDATATRAPFWTEMDTAIAAQNTAEAATPISPPAAETPISPPVAPTPEPDPNIVDQRGDFREGAWVRVNAGEGDCLNARNQPALQNEWVIVNTCLPHGFEGYLTGVAQHADGHWWWFIAGAGWVAEDYLAYVRFVDIRARTVPELAGRGMVAFTRPDLSFGPSIWVMNADGSGQRMLRPATENQYPHNLTWSPDGSRIAFTVQRVSMTGDGGWEVHVMPVDDPAAETVFADVFGAQWSPDGATFATVSDPAMEGIGGGVRGVPAIVDVVTGERRMLGSRAFSQQSAPSFNHDGTKLLLTYADYTEGAADPGARILVWDLAGNELARIEPPADTYYASPAWSPVDDRILFHVGTNTQGQPQYVVYDLGRHDIIGGARVPKASDKIGGRCGSWNMWSATWSGDGARVLYSFDMGDTGANGIWTWDLATGQQTLVPAISTSHASAGPDGYNTFSSAGYDDNFIFVATPGGGFPVLVTDGRDPVWSP